MRNLTGRIGVLGFSALVFFACNQKEDTGSTGNTGRGGSEVQISDLKIAYIHTDSVINNYTYFEERSAEIAEKGKRFEGELSNRAKGFEQEVANFQQSASSMTMNQARAKEEELVSKERNLVSYRDNLMKELSADESNLYNEVYNRIQEYIGGYAKDHDLELILSYTRGGGLWYANEVLDITTAVTEGINKQYETSKSTEEVKEAEKE